MLVRRKNVVVDSDSLALVDSDSLSFGEWTPFFFNGRRYEYSGDVTNLYNAWGRPTFDGRDDPTNVAVLVYLAATPNRFPRIRFFEMDKAPRIVVQKLVARYQQQVADILIDCMYDDSLKSFEEAEIVLNGLYECLKGSV